MFNLFTVNINTTAKTSFTQFFGYVFVFWEKKEKGKFRELH